MRRRQILPETERVRLMSEAQHRTAAPNYTDTQAFQPVRELRPPSDHEACPLCGRKKQGRPKAP